MTQGLITKMDEELNSLKVVKAPTNLKYGQKWTDISQRKTYRYKHIYAKIFSSNNDHRDKSQIVVRFQDKSS